MKIGIAGLGTVGCGLIKMIEQQEGNSGLEIVAVNARSKEKPREADISAYEWVDDALELARRDDIDCVVEMIGGSEGIAKDLVELALDNGKAVITANKALIADHGFEIARRAEEKNAFFGYEAAVAGGIPVIKALRESLSGNNIWAVSGILNGTCNYILTVMRDTGRDFDDVLAEAQELGYAEADPSFDIDGIDTAHKLAILAGLIYGVRVPFDMMPVRGIRQITAADIKHADQMNYRIKLLGLAEKTQDGNIALTVEPCFVAKENPIAHINDVLNAVMIDADPVGRSMLVGRGAGAGPTASAVYSDVVDALHDVKRPLYGVPVEELDDLPADFKSKQDMQEHKYYMRLRVEDRAGVVADIAAILRDQNISISDMVQHGRDEGRPVNLVLMLHETPMARLSRAVDDLQGLDAVVAAPVVMRIV